MALTFEIGDSTRPRGHALVYFRSRTSSEVLATYVIVLPIKMDMGKYLPPLLASQLGGMVGGIMGEGMTAFAAPPAPETVPGMSYVENLARLRGDDLIHGGDLASSDPASAMGEAAGVAQEYHRLYQQYIDSSPVPSEESSSGPEALPDVQRVVYELMGERDRLSELSKLVGTLRFAAERNDVTLLRDTEASVRTLGELLPEHFWVERLGNAAKDSSPEGGQLAQLYVERCYKLMDEDYAAVGDLERRIKELGG